MCNTFLYARENIIISVSNIFITKLPRKSVFSKFINFFKNNSPATIDYSLMCEHCKYFKRKLYRFAQ